MGVGKLVHFHFKVHELEPKPLEKTHEDMWILEGLWEILTHVGFFLYSNKKRASLTLATVQLCN